MAVKIMIPTPLRPYVKGLDEIDLDQEGSVKDLIDGLVTQYPGLKEYLYDAEGQFRKFVNIYVNDEDIRYQQKDKTDVKDGAVVSIVPSIAGGC